MPSSEDQIRALRQQAAMFPLMTKVLREHGNNEMDAIDLFDRAVHARTGEFPNTWEQNWALSEPGTGFDLANKQRHAAEQQAAADKFRRDPKQQVITDKFRREIQALQGQ